MLADTIEAALRKLGVARTWRENQIDSWSARELADALADQLIVTGGVTLREEPAAPDPDLALTVPAR